MRHYWLILVIFLLSSTIPAQDNISNDVLNYINETRQAVGISALVFNTQLQIAAQNHSDDMAQNDRLTHVGSDGSQFWERMQLAGYTLTVGAENVLSRSDTNPENVFNQWFNSEPHRLNMLNGEYVEVGIAYARADSGRFYFTMLLGARSNFAASTQTEIPTTTDLPPTIAPTFTPIPTIISPSPTPAPDSTPQSTTAERASPEIRLIYNDDSLLLVNISGQVLNLTNLIFESNSGRMVATRWVTEFLSQPLSGFTNGDCLQVWTLDVDFLVPPDDCGVRHSWIAIPESSQFWRNSDIFTVRNNGDLVGICSVDFGICEVTISEAINETVAILDPVIFGQIPDLYLEYSDSSFSLINVSGRTLDLSGLVFRSESGVLTIETWNTEFLSQELSNFDDGGCLQTWTPDYPEQAPPSRCQIRHGWILADDLEDFWRQTNSFIIERNGVVIGQCSTNGNQCTISLSDEFGSVPPTQASTVTTQENVDSPSISGFDIQIAITPESVTLINTSGRDLDISGLVFQGTLGIFSAQRWQIPELSAPLTELPAGDCLQVWVLGATVQPAPDICDTRHGWIFATQSEFFWIGDSVYEIWDGNLRLITCEMQASTCNFNMP